MTLPKPTELYLLPHTEKVLIRKIIDVYPDGKKIERELNKDILHDSIESYILTTKIEQDKEKLKLIINFPDVSYKVVWQEYNKKSREFLIDIEHYAGFVIL